MNFARIAVLAFAIAITAIAPSAVAQTSPAHFALRVVGSGRPMLLIPGLTSGGAVWDSTVDALKGDFQCHIFSLAGFAGQAPIVIDSAWLTRVRDAIVAYAKEKKLERPIIVGHSLG